MWMMIMTKIRMVHHHETTTTNPSAMNALLRMVGLYMPNVYGGIRQNHCIASTHAAAAGSARRYYYY